MSSKFLISSDSIGWTFAKPAMLVAAAIGGVSGHPVPAGNFTAPRQPATPGAAVSPGFTIGLAATTVPTVRPAQSRLAATRPAALPPAAAEPAPATSAFIQAFPELPGGLGAEPLPTTLDPAQDPAAPAQFAVTTWGIVPPAIQQTIAPAAVPAPSLPETSAPTATIPETALSNLRLPQPAQSAAAPQADIATPNDAVRFVSVAVVQPLPAPATSAELVLGAPTARAPSATSPAIAKPRAEAPAPLARAPLVRKAPEKAASTFAPAPATKPLASTASRSKAYSVTEGMIDFALSTRVNGVDAGPVALRVGPDDRLSLRLGDLLGLVKARMAPAEFARFSAAASAADYVDFETVRAAGIGLRYDAVHNRIELGAQ